MKKPTAAECETHTAEVLPLFGEAVAALKRVVDCVEAFNPRSELSRRVRGHYEGMKAMYNDGTESTPRILARIRAREEGAK